jgi:3-phenylpropionate/cinnamic acid dioxygenase small subunit
MTSVDSEPRSDAGIPPYEQVYGEILGFLIEEAALLDDDRHMEWLDLLTDDVTYSMPVRETYHRRDGRGFATDAGLFDDTKMTLTIRARRNVEFVNAFDRDPAPRITRLVSNLVVRQGEREDEYLATSSVLLLRSQYAEREQDMLAAKREDVVRRTPEGLKLARRLILTNQAAFSANYMNVFL